MVGTVYMHLCCLLNSSRFTLQNWSEVITTFPLGMVLNDSRPDSSRGKHKHIVLSVLLAGGNAIGPVLHCPRSEDHKHRTQTLQEQLCKTINAAKETHLP